MLNINKIIYYLNQYTYVSGIGRFVFQITQSEGPPKLTTSFVVDCVVDFLPQLIEKLARGGRGCPGYITNSNQCKVQVNFLLATCHALDAYFIVETSGNSKLLWT